jgi:hypothetical protein
MSLEQAAYKLITAQSRRFSACPREARRANPYAQQILLLFDPKCVGRGLKRRVHELALVVHHDCIADGAGCARSMGDVRPSGCRFTGDA